MNIFWLARLIPKRKSDNNFLVKILSRFSATRLRSVLPLVNKTSLTTQDRLFSLKDLSL